MIKEGAATISIPQQAPTKKMTVFYNPAMKLNRDISISILNTLHKKIRIADILAGTGIRSIRILKEIPNIIKEIVINDANPKATIKKNLAKNQVEARVEKTEATKFLLKEKAFDYIEIDPFGSPNPFLDAAVKRIRPEGIIAITATDTAALAGTSPQACKRKYYAQPLHNELMHEIGSRILIRKAQLIGAQYDVALIPIYTHSTLHYQRTYLQAKHGKKNTDEVLLQHKYFHYCNLCLNRFVSDFNKEICCKKTMTYAGPIWTGQLWNTELTKKISLKEKMIQLIAKESEIPTVGFYDVHKYAEKHKKSVPSYEKIFKAIKYPAAITHYTYTGIRTTMPPKEFDKMIKKL